MKLHVEGDPPGRSGQELAALVERVEVLRAPGRIVHRAAAGQVGNRVKRLKPGDPLRADLRRDLFPVIGGDWLRGTDHHIDPAGRVIAGVVGESPVLAVGVVGQRAVSDSDRDGVAVSVGGVVPEVAHAPDGVALAVVMDLHRTVAAGEVVVVRRVAHVEMVIRAVLQNQVLRLVVVARPELDVAPGGEIALGD